MKPYEPYYYEGSSRHDPGWYWSMSEADPFANGPYFCFGDAAKDCDLAKDIQGVATFYREVLHKDTLTVAKVEYVVRSYALGASIIMALVMFWYGMYKVIMAGV